MRAPRTVLPSLTITQRLPATRVRAQWREAKGRSGWAPIRDDGQRGGAGPVAVVQMAHGKANALATDFCRSLAAEFGGLTGLPCSRRTYRAAEAVGLGLADKAVAQTHVLARAVEVAAQPTALPGPLRHTRGQIRGPAVERIA